MSHSCRDRQLSHLRMLFDIPGPAPTIIHLSLSSSFTTHLKPQCPLEVPALGTGTLRHSDDFFVTTCRSLLKLCIGLSHSIPNFLRAGTRWYSHIGPHTLVAYHNVSDFKPTLMFLKTEKKRRGREGEGKGREGQESFKSVLPLVFPACGVGITRAASLSHHGERRGNK